MATKKKETKNTETIYDYIKNNTEEIIQCKTAGFRK